MFYKPFPYFTEHDDPEDDPGRSAIQVIEILIRRGRYDDARDAAAQLIRNALAGLRYLETFVTKHVWSCAILTYVCCRYDRTLIRTIVFVAYTGWIAFSAVHILPSAWTRPFGDQSMLNIFSVSCLLVSWALFALQHTSWSLYVYVTFPVYFWREAVSRCGGSLEVILTARPAQIVKLLFGAGLAGAALESMVVRG